MCEPLTSRLQNSLRRSGQLILAPLYVLRATDIDAKQIRRADIVSGNEPPGLSYDNNYSNRLFDRNIFRIAALYSAGLDLLSNAKSKDWSSRPTNQFFSLAVIRLGQGKDGDKTRPLRNDLTDYKTARREGFRHWVIRRRRRRPGKLRD